MEADLCPEDRDVSANLVADMELNAQKTISTVGTVIITGDMVFKAGTSITLNPGFHARAGSNFSAIMQTCTPTSGNIQDKVSNDNLKRIEGNLTDKPTSFQATLSVMPNPFRGETTIQYQLRQTEEVLIQVMDVNGKVVQVLENQVTKSAGLNEAKFSGDMLDAGMYAVSYTHLTLPTILLV